MRASEIPVGSLLYGREVLSVETVPVRGGLVKTLVFTANRVGFSFNPDASVRVSRPLEVAT